MKKRSAIILIPSVGAVLCLAAFALFYMKKLSEPVVFTVLDNENLFRQWGCGLPAPPSNKNQVTFILGGDHRVFYHQNPDLGILSLLVFAPGKISEKEKQQQDSLNNACRKVELTELSWDNTLPDLLKQKNASTLVKLSELEEEKNTMPDTSYRKRLASINSKSDAVTAVIKTDSTVKYGDVIKLLDELKSQKVSKFVLLDLHKEEKEALQKVLAVKP